LYHCWATAADTSEKQQHQDVLIDYAQAALDVELYLDNVEGVIRWCSHLIPHLHTTSDLQRAEDLHKLSLSLVRTHKPVAQDLVDTLYEQGTQNFYAGAAPEAEESWKQAQMITEMLGDDRLAKKLNRRIEWAKVMVDLERSAHGGRTAGAI
jgi:hypothetical protein